MTDYLIENTITSFVFWAIGILALWLAFGVLGIAPTGSFPQVPAAKWQAVFLTNNQVYFGKLKGADANYVTLSNVYYLRTATDLDQASGSNLNLIKLGGEVHGPEDSINIPKTSILFWENMKDTSRVVQTINSATK